MKQTLTIFIFFVVAVLHAQVDSVTQTKKNKSDKFGIEVNLSVGVNWFYFDQLEDYSFQASAPSYDTIYGLAYQHYYSKIRALDIMPHIGFHIPILHFGKISLGLNTTIGTGRQFEISHLDSNEWHRPKVDLFKVDAHVYSYFRYQAKKFHFQLKYGLRHIRSYDNYTSHVLAAQFGPGQWNFGFYTNLQALKYYRLFSNGQTELARSVFEFGFTGSYNLQFKPRNKSQITDEKLDDEIKPSTNGDPVIKVF